MILLTFSHKFKPPFTSIDMDERIPEVLTAITLLLIGLFLVLGKVLFSFNLDENLISAITQPLSWLMFIFVLATAIVLLKDAIKKRDED